MSNDSSLQENVFAFDLDSQNGVTHLLSSLRASDITHDEKNELRDLIFQYTNGGKDPSVRIHLEQKVVSSQLVPLPLKNKQIYTEQPVYQFGALRPSPFFVTPAKKDVVVQASDVATPSQLVPPSAVQQTPAVASASVLTPVTPQPAVVPAPPVAPKPVIPVVAPAPILTSTPVDGQAPVAVKQVSPQPSVSTSPAPTDSPSEFVGPEQTARRIREIKSIVNDKVGNPVNLVDINNDVGREYMAALLDAMKKQSSGTSVISAMRRLEVAFQSVEKTLEDRNATPPKPVNDDAQVPMPAVASAPLSIQDEVNAQPKVAKAVLPPLDLSPKAANQSNSPLKVKSQIPPRAAAPLKTSVPPSQLPVVETSVVPNKVTLPDVSAKPEAPTIQSPKSVSIPTPAPITEAVAVPVPTPKPVTSIPKPVVPTPVGKPILESTPIAASSASASNSGVKPLVSLSDASDKLKHPEDVLPSSSLETSSVAGDPLFTTQVDTGLHQLLSEWSIFKKSGLFGTGPKGKEHPLFIKISGLPTPLLLAGRFDGSTQEIKQSITDYMNGWRYEQGIIYEQGETFEHYLRRVILHILDLQKRTKRP